MVSCFPKILFPRASTVLIFCIAGLLILCASSTSNIGSVSHPARRPAFSSHLINGVIVQVECRAAHRASLPTNQDLTLFRYHGLRSGRRVHLTSRVSSMHVILSVSLRVGLLATTVFGFLQPAFAGIRPSFSLDYSSWHATEIVLVEVTPMFGVFRVVESW